MSWKKMSLRTKAILLVSVFLIVTNVGLGTALMRQSQYAMKTLIDDRMLDIVNTAAATLDGDVIDRLTAEDKGTAEYQAVYATAMPGNIRGTITRELRLTLSLTVRTTSSISVKSNTHENHLP